MKIIILSILITLGLFAQASEQPKKQYSVLGSIDPKVIQNIIQSHDYMFKNCFKKKVKKAFLNFTIEPNGTVGKYKITFINEQKDNDAQKCAEKILSRIKFPETEGIKEVKNLLIP